MPDPTAKVPTGHIALRLPARAEYIRLCRALAGTVGEMCRLDAAQVVDLKLAVTEACGNAVRHAYRAVADDGRSDERQLEIECRLGDEQVAIAVRDWGLGVDPALPAGHSGGAGLGFHLIEALADDVTVSTGAGGVGTIVNFRTPAR